MKHRKQKKCSAKKKIKIFQHDHKYLLTPRTEVTGLDHTDGVIASGSGHGPYLSVGVISDVILQNSVNITTDIST